MQFSLAINTLKIYRLILGIIITFFLAIGVLKFIRTKRLNTNENKVPEEFNHFFLYYLFPVLLITMLINSILIHPRDHYSVPVLSLFFVMAILGWQKITWNEKYKKIKKLGKSTLIIFLSAFFLLKTFPLEFSQRKIIFKNKSNNKTLNSIYQYVKTNKENKENFSLLTNLDRSMYIYLKASSDSFWVKRCSDYSTCKKEATSGKYNAIALLKEEGTTKNNVFYSIIDFSYSKN